MNDSSCLYESLVLIMVMEPLPLVWILVRDVTVFPDKPKLLPLTNLHGRVTESVTGWGIAFDVDGVLRIW